MSDARTKAVERLAAVLWAYHFGCAPGEFASETQRKFWLADAESKLDTLGLVAVPPELVEAVREADALVERLEAPYRRGDGVLEFKRMEDAIPIDRAQAEANERRQELADAVLAQLGGKP